LKLDLARGARDNHMRERIAVAEKDAAGSGATDMADLLELWARIRATPPWLVKPSKVTQADTNDWQDDADQLKILEARLEELNNPACQLLLQGVRSDRKRIDGTVERLRSAR
jgi:hypothetical protein